MKRSRRNAPAAAGAPAGLAEPVSRSSAHSSWEAVISPSR